MDRTNSSLSAVKFRFLTVLLLCCGQGEAEFQICDEDAECPTGAICFRDYCARCECLAGQSVTNYIVGTSVIKMCISDDETKVGDSCSARFPVCPPGSHCDDVTAMCVCDDGLAENEDRTYCRPALFGEQCGHHVSCDVELGLQCQGHPSLCICGEGYRSPDVWTQYINRRWQYSRIGRAAQNCVPRSIGDPCRHDAHCSAVGGSGAQCRCRFCQCTVDDHVPDIHGTTCGPALNSGDICHLDDGVCDGSRGLQCGDECDFYHYDYRSKVCHCSSMHDYQEGTCLPKIAGSACRTDWDCSLLVGGIGICELQTCTLAANTTEHIPRMFHRKCQRRKHTTSIPDALTTAFNESRETGTKEQGTSQEGTESHGMTVALTEASRKERFEKNSPQVTAEVIPNRRYDAVTLETVRGTVRSSSQTNKLVKTRVVFLLISTICVTTFTVE